MMRKTGRYDVSALTEAQFEPGSRGRVLRYLLGITRVREMNRAETVALQSAMDSFLGDSTSNIASMPATFARCIAPPCKRVWTATTGRWQRSSRPLSRRPSASLDRERLGCQREDFCNVCDTATGLDRGRTGHARD